VETAASKTERARLLKIADKTANLRSILQNPPDGWDEVRKKEYFEWAKSVVENCRGINPLLEQWFDETYARY
jgi:guanosine-3',5'-bis(diphosphate) 3'-pyrophosphohydrolase